MKKTITICFLIAITFAGNAQTKKTTTSKTPIKNVAKTELADTAIAVAPQKGPTKEQTIAFIKDYFKDGITTVSYEKTQNADVSHTYKFSDFEFNNDNTILTINYNEEHQYFYSSEKFNRLINQTTYSKQKFVIDLKNIEKINLSWREAPSGVEMPVAYTIYLDFKAVPGYSIDSYTVSGEKDITLDQITLPNQAAKKNKIKLEVNFFQAENNFDISSEGNNKKILQAFNHLRKLCGAPEPISFD